MRRPGPRNSSHAMDDKPWHRAMSILPTGTRGQTPLDFSLGTSLFLLALATLFMTLPGIIAPFDSPGSQGNMLRTERASAQLTNNLITDNRHVGQPTSLDTHCTKAFFDDSVDASTCPFTQSESLQTQLGLREIDDVNVTIYDMSNSIATVDGSTLATGDTPPDRQRTITTTRIVYLNGDPHRLTVTLW